MRVRRKMSRNYTTLSYTSPWRDGTFLIRFKGDPVAQAAEQSQANFDNTLQGIFSAQYGKQSAITDYLTQQMEPLISAGGQGYSSQALAAMRTSATDTLSNQFTGAQRAINATEQR